MSFGTVDVWACIDKFRNRIGECVFYCIANRMESKIEMIVFVGRSTANRLSLISSIVIQCTIEATLTARMPALQCWRISITLELKCIFILSARLRRNRKSERALSPSSSFYSYGERERAPKWVCHSIRCACVRGDEFIYTFPALALAIPSSCQRCRYLYPEYRKLRHRCHILASGVCVSVHEIMKYNESIVQCRLS